MKIIEKRRRTIMGWIALCGIVASLALPVVAGILGYYQDGEMRPDFSGFSIMGLTLFGLLSLCTRKRREFISVPDKR